ncbi:hypothetical protein M3J09_003022 [Ascochyta lentis]
MPPPPLRLISLEASLQSHGNDTLPPSPSRRGSGPSTFSPADCRALKKILRDVGNSSPPSTPSPPDLGEQLFTNTDCTSDNIDCGAVDDNHHLVGNEATDTGYEDEDDSMELSDSLEDIAAGDSVSVPEKYTLRTVSCSDRRPQDRVSTHDKKDRLRYSDRRSLGAKYPRARQQEQEYKKSAETKEDDTVEDIMNLPGKRAPPARPQDLGRNNSDRQPIPDDIKQLNRMRLSMERVLENELVEQERRTCEQEPGVFLPGHDDPRRSATISMKQQPVDEASDADNEDNDTIDDTAETKHVKGAQIPVPHLKAPTTPVVMLPRTQDVSMLLVPNTPITTAQASAPNHVRIATDQTVPETPFTKTLNYFRQYKGVENSPFKRRRNTALPQEITTVGGIDIDAEDKSFPEEQEEPRHIAPHTVHTSALPMRSALADLEGMALPRASSEEEQDTIVRAGEPHQAHAVLNNAPEDISKENGACTQSETDNTQRQLILYPQHPAFVKAIGMIPATIFWMTAAPIVKYTNVTVDFLVDKLRDTYL